jgi:hypothetical protein
MYVCRMRPDSESDSMSQIVGKSTYVERAPILN